MYVAYAEWIALMGHLIVSAPIKVNPKLKLSK